MSRIVKNIIVKNFPVFTVPANFEIPLIRTKNICNLYKKRLCGCEKNITCIVTCNTLILINQ